MGAGQDLRVECEDWSGWPASLPPATMVADAASLARGAVAGLVRAASLIYVPAYGRAPETRDARENPAGQEAQYPLVTGAENRGTR